MENAPVPPSESAGLYQWQQSRRRTGGAFAEPMTGFGPGGRLTLWLPAAKPTANWRVMDGKPVLVAVESEIDPELERLRRLVLVSAQSVGPGIVVVQPAFYEYAAHAIRKNYDMPDADLEFALFGGVRAWQGAMITHVLGGADMVEALSGAADARATNGEASGEAFVLMAFRDAEAPTVHPAPERPANEPLWRRVWARVRSIGR